MESIIFRFFYKTTAILLLLLAFNACNTANEDQRKFEDEAFSEPQGFTATDDRGNVIEGEEDPDDWRIAPLFVGLIEVRIPAYPNPVTPGIDNNVSIEFDVFVDESIHGLRIYGYNENDNRVPLMSEHVDRTLDAILHEFTFDPNKLSQYGSRGDITGLHRIYITDRNDELITYGDIMIE